MLVESAVVVSKTFKNVGGENHNENKIRSKKSGLHKLNYVFDESKLYKLTQKNALLKIFLLSFPHGTNKKRVVGEVISNCIQFPFFKLIKYWQYSKKNIQKNSTKIIRMKKSF